MKIDLHIRNQFRFIESDDPALDDEYQLITNENINVQCTQGFYAVTESTEEGSILNPIVFTSLQDAMKEAIKTNETKTEG